MHHNYILPFLDATGRPGSGGLAVIIRLAHAHLLQNWGENKLRPNLNSCKIHFTSQIKNKILDKPCESVTTCTNCHTCTFR